MIHKLLTGHYSMMSLLVLIVAVIATTQVVLSGCAAQHKEINMYALSENELADECMEHMLKAVSNKDKEALTDMFSTACKNEMNQVLFENQVDTLFNALSGDVLSYHGFLSTVNNNHEGEHNHQIRGFYTVETTSDVYHFCFTYRDRDEENQDKVGLSMIILVTDELFNSDGFSWKYTRDPGIYIEG